MAARRQVGDSYGGYRTRLVETLRQQGIDDMAVLAAVAHVPRHLFVPEALRGQAYEDTSLPIGNGQTISQPSTHARYLQTLGLRGRERVLEIGTGSGYQTALLSRLADIVLSIERVPALAGAARAALAEAGCANTTVIDGDGTLGYLPMAPYNAILVSAAGPDVPEALKKQLADGGRMLIPLAGQTGQKLVLVRRRGDEYEDTDLGDVKFVPLIGQQGYNGETR